MNRSLSLARGALLVFVLGSFTANGTAQTQSVTSVLKVGDSLPDISGWTPSGNSLSLSGVIAGKTSVVVFSFSKSAGKDAKTWNEHLDRDYGADRLVACSTVIMLEGAPRFLRGIIVSGLKRSMPPSMADKTIVSYENEGSWKRRLTVVDDSHAYVLVLGPDGRVRWRNLAAFSDAAYTELKVGIQEQLRLQSPASPE